MFETKQIYSTSTEYLGIKFIKHVYDYTLKEAKILLREIRTHNAMSVRASQLGINSPGFVLVLFLQVKYNAHKKKLSASSFGDISK